MVASIFYVPAKAKAPPCEGGVGSKVSGSSGC